MVDKQDINPQQFARRRGRSVATIEAQQAPSLRNVPDVSPVAEETQTEALIAMSRDSERLKRASADQFSSQIKEVQTLQAVEADKKFSEAQLQFLRESRQIRSEAEDAEAITELEAQAYDDVIERNIGQADLSDFQRQYLAGKINQGKAIATENALNYQTELRRTEAEFAIQEVSQSKIKLVAEEPSLLVAMEAEADQLIDSYGGDLTAIERAQLKDSYIGSLQMAAAEAKISASPESALNAIKDGSMKTDRLVKDQIDQLESMAVAESKARRSQVERQRQEMQEQVSRDLTGALIAEATGQADEQGNPISLSVTEINKALSEGMLSSSTARALFNLKSDLSDRVGNSTLEANLYSRILSQEQTDDPLTFQGILVAQDKAVRNGQQGLNASQISRLQGAIEDKNEPIISAAINNVFKPAFFEPNLSNGGFFTNDPKRGQAFNEAVTELRSIARIKSDQGVSPSALVTRGSGHFVLDGIIEAYSQGLDDRSDGLGSPVQFRPSAPLPNLPDNYKIVPNQRTKDGRIIIEIEGQEGRFALSKEEMEKFGAN